MPKNIFSHIHRALLFTSSALIVTVVIAGATSFFWQQTKRSLDSAQQQAQVANAKIADYSAQLTSIQAELTTSQNDLQKLKNADQFKRNEALQAQITAIHDQFTKSVTEYEDIVKLRDLGTKTDKMDALFAQTLVLLSQRNYASASGILTQLSQEIQKAQNALAASSGGAALANAMQSNDAPGSGYRRQTVKSDVGTFGVDIIAADLGSTRVVVETASGSDCANNCPLAPLADFVNRSHGYAGVNSSYFCPAAYPSCAGKTNSFDTLLMNRNKTYFNSANNVYSSVPVAIFAGNSARFIAHSSGWGRDTGVDSVIAGQPLLLLNGDIQFGGDGDPKKNSHTGRAFIGSKGSTVYIGAVHGATVVEMAHVLKTLGLQNAINLDDAGSLALYFNGHYVAGPGRTLPWGIVFVRK